MLKYFPVLTLILVFLNVSSLLGQGIDITSVDAGPYTPGSTIGVLFKISAATNIRPDNIFTLYLSDAAGSFASEKEIGKFSGLYNTFVNGVIPAGTAAGTGYKVRIKSSSPALVTAASTTFQIRAGAAVKAQISNRNVLDPVTRELFGFCSGRDKFNYNLENESTTGAAVSARITNELTGAAEPVINFNVSAKTFTARQTHYTVFVKAVLAGNVATKVYMIVNNRAITAFGTSGTVDVCLGGDPREFNVLVNDENGIVNNYPGTTYNVDWGDNTNNVYTIKDIIANNNKVGHIYTSVACGNQIDLGSTTVYNAFGISIFSQNQYCGTVGTPISTYAKISVRPVNAFTVPPTLCTNADAIFVNTSVLGDNPDSNGPGCTPNNATFTWYIDGEVVPEAIDKPRSFKLSYRFTPGNHTITLESTSNTACPPLAVTKSICVQQPAQPSFTLNGTSTGLSICNSGTLTPVNTSVVDDSSCGTNTYTWSILPATYSLLGGSTLNSAAPPQIKFNAPGAYKIKLTINASLCGEVSTPEQIVLVSAPPTADLSPNIVLCNYRTYDFDGTAGPTRTVLNGTPDNAMEPETYTWEVSGGLADFVNGTTIHSRYPSIQFKEFKVYTVKVTHSNSCGTVSDTQVIEFRTSPIVIAGDYSAICFESAVQLDASPVPGYTPVWVGGEGTFFPDRNARDAIYTPSDAEAAAGHVELLWQITTTLAAPCQEVYDVAAITIKPRNTITSAGSISICSGTSVNYTPLSTVAGSTFTWTATGTAGATGFTANGNGAKISDIITNQNATSDATVTYHITPTSGQCVGDPFDLVVTVTPNPVLAAHAVNLNICSGETPLINISNNLPASYDVKYIYTSASSSASITGNTSSGEMPVSLTAISDILVNSGTTPGTVTYQISAVSSTGCSGATETIVITVNPPGTVASAGADETVCSNIAYPLEANIPEGTSTGKWTLVSGSPITFTDDTKYNTTVNGLNPDETYTFRWTITTEAGCFTYDDVIVTNLPQLGNINITGTAEPVCQGTEVTLVGETPTGGDGKYTYTWENSEDDGANWTLMPGEIGKDLVVNVNTTTNYRRITRGGICVLVSNALKIVAHIPPVSIFSPGSTLGCSPLPVNFVNTSPESPGTVYTYDWGDGSATETFTDRADVVHTYSAMDKTVFYTVKMTASNACGSNTSQHTISIAPNKIFAELVVEAADKQGCAPLLVHFSNNSANANSYTYDFGDGTTQVSNTAPEMITHTFTKPGTYVVTLTATNYCTTTTTTETILVYEQPTTRFIIDKTIGYPGQLIQFTNESVGGIKYLWDFGDGGTSIENNPSHTYQEVGTFKVTLTASNVTGCTSSYSFDMVIDGEPGSLYVPNAFIPSSEDPQFREFKAKGTGISSWRMSIFDKWGTLLWETTKLEDGKPVDGWDGTYKGQKMPQGVYYWKIDLQLRNGSEWRGISLNSSAPKRTGSINLIR